MNRFIHLGGYGGRSWTWDSSTGEIIEVDGYTVNCAGYAYSLADATTQAKAWIEELKEESEKPYISLEQPDTREVVQSITTDRTYEEEEEK